VKADDNAGFQQVIQDCYVLTATGHDRIGFVADHVLLCAEGINIIDLSTTISMARM
jgi:predicted amino acid-binding ACT domain protein